MSQMNRRDFTRSLSAVALASGALGARAQGGPVEGRDFAKLDKPVAVSPGKVEVVEFFGYWCPHCNAFEPSLEAWARQQSPANLLLRRVPVAFSPTQEPLQRLYFAIEALGLTDSLHRKVFTAIHVGRQLPPAAQDSDIAAFLKAQGADVAKVMDTMKGFAVATKVRQARPLADAYGLDSVPTLGVQGRWRTSPSMAGSHERVLAVVDALVAQARKGG